MFKVGETLVTSQSVFPFDRWLSRHAVPSQGVARHTTRFKPIGISAAVVLCHMWSGVTLLSKCHCNKNKVRYVSCGEEHPLSFLYFFSFPFPSWADSVEEYDAFKYLENLLVEPKHMGQLTDRGSTDAKRKSSLFFSHSAQRDRQATNL